MRTNLAKSFIAHGAAQTRVIHEAAWEAINAASNGDVDGMVMMARRIMAASEDRDRLLTLGRALAENDRRFRREHGFRM